jgi:hypothetical protein
MRAIHDIRLGSDETNSFDIVFADFVSIVLNELSQTFGEVCRGSNYKCVLGQNGSMPIHPSPTQFY